MAGGSRLLAVLAVAVIVALQLGVGVARADRACAEAVLADWSDGRIDRAYAAECYLEAVEILPEDVRAYTSAADDIERALQALPAGGTAGESRSLTGVGDVDGSSAEDGVARDVPAAIVGLAGVAFVVLAAGAGGLLARRVRVRRRA